MAEKLYEGMFLFDANLAGKDWPGLEQHVHDLLKKHGAKLEYSERWPDRKLAYEIGRSKKGTYYLTYFKSEAEGIVGLERDCQLSERILRLLVLHDPSLVEECRKRVSREVQGPPEDIEAAEAAAAAAAATAASVAAKAASAANAAAVATAEAGAAGSPVESETPTEA